jgi:hypothetical protein
MKSFKLAPLMCLARDRPGGRKQTIHLSDLQEQSHGPSSQPSPLSQSFESQEERSSVPFTVDVGGQWIPLWG